MAVRRALSGLFRDDRLGNLPDDQRGTAELLLAEVLNNVVEHAYADRAGDIEVTVAHCGRSLVFRVVDRGKELPGHVLTPGQTGDNGPQGDLPEGGFGWPMIRALAKEVDYRRQDGCNQLSFRLDLA
ncbi:MAG: ATP-binding protein [Rhodobacter sp.]|nr:ATP-binding protein [Rhodobacter sp.]MCA3523659.1 ATP-binding protein [Rhodobacter sp.]MCA3526865.1 ATP-binding protein [Rhodobacter sp.]MCA3527937.1 ATP-binding protein [Rhodobacter sp.]MCA3533056.1 ATP-binding protein [Rhodobacter sp.]